MSNIGEYILPKPENEKEKDLYNVIDNLMKNLKKVLNRGIIFSDNIDCKLVTFTSSETPDAENTVAHTLGKVPTGVIVYSQDKAGSLYNGTTAFTTTNIYLKSSVATVVFKIIVF